LLKKIIQTLNQLEVILNIKDGCKFRDIKSNDLIFNYLRLMLVAFILLYKNYSKISKLEPYKLVILTMILSICVGVHGLSHAGLESIYNFNPMAAF